MLSGRMADTRKNPPDRFRTLLFFGAPGCGKGTQGRVLGLVPRFFPCACGEVFRSLDTRTELGREFVKYSSRGQLVPDDITVKLWKAAIDAKVDAHAFKPDIDFYSPEILTNINAQQSPIKVLQDIIFTITSLRIWEQTKDEVC